MSLYIEGMVYAFYQMNTKINDIIIKHLTRECSPEEEKALHEWCNQSDENYSYFQKITYTWLSSAQLREKPGFQTVSALNRFYSEISGQEIPIASETNPGTLNKTFILKLFKYAAVFVLIFSIGLTSSLFLFNKTDTGLKKQQCYYEIPIGSKGKVVLPDGTSVWLNAGSNLSYSTDYNSQSRVVHLTGEGFFDVVTNPQKPFIVKAKNLNIKAYGTSFNVKAYSDEKGVITTLVKGKVLIEGKNSKNKSFSVEMKPRQSVICFTDIEDKISFQADKETNNELPVATGINPPTTDKAAPVLAIDSVKTELYTSWKDPRWIIENISLSDLIKKLERRYNVTFTLGSDDLRQYHFTGIIQNESIEQVLAVLRFTLPVKYSINKDHIELTLDSELKQKYMQAL